MEQDMDNKREISLIFYLAILVERRNTISQTVILKRRFAEYVTKMVISSQCVDLRNSTVKKKKKERATGISTSYKKNEGRSEYELFHMCVSGKIFVTITLDSKSVRIET